MAKNEDTGSPGWTASASYIMQTTEDVVARAVAAAAAAATAHTSRPSVVFSSKDEYGNSQLQKLQKQVNRVLKGFSSPPEVYRGAYNPEVLTSQKRQWASLQLQSLDQRPFKEPSKLFESMVVVGLHPSSDVHALQRRIYEENSDCPKRIQTAPSLQHQIDGEPKLEPQVLFVYPPEKQLPLKYKDLLSFCFPGGVEVHAVEKTPSMSELNEILLGQEHLKQSDLSFVFRLQVADDSTLYGCCVLVEEVVQKPSGLISMITEEQSICSSLSRLVITTPRCYCILSRLPFFDLHFGVLKSIFSEERLERLTKGVGTLGLFASEDTDKEQKTHSKSANCSPKHYSLSEMQVGPLEMSEASAEVSPTERSMDNGSDHEHLGRVSPRESNDAKMSFQVNAEVGGLTNKSESEVIEQFSNGKDILVDDCTRDKQTIEKRLPETLLPLLRRHQYESSESSSSFQGSPCEDRHCRSDLDETEMEEASSSGQEDSNDRQEDSNDHIDILEWAKANNHGSLRIICEYYRLRCPARGSMLTFHPLEHLHPLEFHRPAETIFHIAGSTIDLRSCRTSLEVAEAHGALLSEEEAVALSIWTVACICGNLRLEHVLTMFAGALLEKQILVVCSNLGILSAIILSIIPLIRPYQWQSLLMPVLPNDMLEFLDAPVPYVVGIKKQSSEIQSKLANVILIDANKNQVKSPGLPQLPQQKELLSSLSPYHAKLVGESFLARKRPVYECTDVQVEAVKGFLAVLRSYLDSLCSNLRSHTITNVQSNDDKVSLLLKESFIDSFQNRDRPFMKVSLPEAAMFLHHLFLYPHQTQLEKIST